MAATRRLGTRSRRLLALKRAGIAAQFFELAGAHHGEYGPEGERAMDEAIAFVARR